MQQPSRLLVPLGNEHDRFAGSDEEVERGINGQGRFRVGAPRESLPEYDPASGATRDDLLSEADKRFRDYKVLLVKEIDRLLSLPVGLRPDMKEASKRAAEEVYPPPGVPRYSARTALKAYRRFRMAGCRDALAPKSAIKGNRDPRKPDFVVDAIEEALDQRYCGKGSLPRVQELAIRLAKQGMPADLSVYTRTVRDRDGTLHRVSLIDRDENGDID